MREINKLKEEEFRDKTRQRYIEEQKKASELIQKHREEMTNN